MHNMILGKRKSAAQTLIMANALLLAAHFKIDDAQVSALKVQEKDPIVKALKEQEAVALLLETITIKLGLAAPAPVEEVIPAVEDADGGLTPVDAEGAGVTTETGEGLPAPVVEKHVAKSKHHK